MGGSMGAVVGEKVTRAAEHALTERMPLIIVSASGGARMQEGTLALMQLAKTCAALERLRTAGLPYISVMTDPTTGGVFASYAVLGDINLAEPNALIGFAGARVAAGTIAQELPPGFQRSEFLFDHGFLDRVVHRRELRSRSPSSEVPPPAPMLEPDEGRPTFNPIGFLTSLAEKVVPDLNPVEEAPVPGGSGPSASATGAAGRERPGSQRSARPAATSTRRSQPGTPADGDREAPRG